MSVLRVCWWLPCLIVLCPACPASDERPTDATDAADTTDTADTAPEVAPDGADESDGATDVAPETAEEVVPVGCQPFDFTGSLVAKGAPGVFQLGGQVDLGLGGPLPDAMIFEFYSDETGTFDLASGGNENYKTCDQCVRFVQDIDPTGVAVTKNFFQKSGTLTIDPATPPNGTELVLTLTDIEFIEVTIRAADFHTTPVDNGLCYARAASFVLQTGACVPACGDHVCGPDGCGGECGAGCRADERCHLDGSKCEATSTCVPIAIEGVLENTGAGVFRVDVTRLGLGAVDQEDFVQLEFYKDDVGTLDLSGTANRNYSTCNQCFRLIVDGRTELFQRQGELIVSEASSVLGDPDVDGYVDLQMRSVVLEQVIIDDEFNSMVMPNGACVEVRDGRLASPARN